MFGNFFSYPYELTCQKGVIPVINAFNTSKHMNVVTINMLYQKKTDAKL